MKGKKKYRLLLGISSLFILPGLLLLIIPRPGPENPRSESPRSESPRPKSESYKAESPMTKSGTGLSQGPQSRVDGKKKDLSESVKGIFETFTLTPIELESFHARRYEKREVTREIVGLKIDRKAFKVGTAKELPKKLRIPLPGEGIKEFELQHVDFKNGENFVWVGNQHRTNWRADIYLFMARPLRDISKRKEALMKLKPLRAIKTLSAKLMRPNFQKM